MTGILNSEVKAMVVVKPAELAERLGFFAMFGSVHGYAQSVVLIPADDSTVASGVQQLRSCSLSGATLSSAGTKFISVSPTADR